MRDWEREPVFTSGNHSMAADGILLRSKTVKYPFQPISGTNRIQCETVYETRRGAADYIL